MATVSGPHDRVEEPVRHPRRGWAKHDHDAAPPTRPLPPAERGLRLFLRKLAQLLELDPRPR